MADRQADLSQELGASLSARSELAGSAAGNAQSGWYLSETPAGSSLTVELDPETVLGGRFTVKQSLGRGATGVVYLGVDRVRGDQVALKIIDRGPWRPGNASSAPIGEMNARRKIADFRHILMVHDVHPVRYGGRSLLLISMEFADGGSLRDWLLRNRNDIHTRRAEGLQLFAQACRGVETIHAANQLHLDLKPENLLLAGGMVKVADLEDSPGAAEAGAKKGTPAYSSPELVACAGLPQPGPAADIYALGCILHEMLDSACQPWHQRGRPVNPCNNGSECSRLDGVSEATHRVVSRCLHHEPEDRYPNVTALLDDVLALCDQREPAEALWRMTGWSLCKGRLAEAAEHCESLLAACPDHQAGRTLRGWLQRRNEEAERLACTLEGEWDSLSLADRLHAVKQAIIACPDHLAVRDRLMNVANQARRYREAMERGRAALADGCLDTAMMCFHSARQVDPDTVESERPVRLVGRFLEHVEHARSQIEDALNRADWPRVFQLADCLLQYTNELRRSASLNSPGGQE